MQPSPPSVERKKMLHKVERLSSAGRQTVDIMLARDASYPAIARELKNKTGESVSDSSLQRYRSAIWLKEPKAEREPASRLYQILGELLIVASEIRDGVRALNARQLRVVGSGQEAAKETTEKKGGEGE